MTRALTGISSMATRQLLAELLPSHTRRGGPDVHVESVGGVEAARRVQDGEAFDVVILAADALAKLEAGGHLVPGSTVALVRSGVAMAVRAGAPHPDISSEAAVRRAVLAARTIGYSTGPSGIALKALFERWGIGADIADRLRQAPTGVPVGSLVASGDVELGFQQLSELIHVDGIDLLGPLPDDIQITTIFAGAVGTRSAQPDAARDLLAYLAGPDTADAKRREGMEPALPLHAAP